MRRLFARLLVLGVAACGTMNFDVEPPPVYVVFFADHSVELRRQTATKCDCSCSSRAQTTASMIQVAGPSTQMSAPHSDPSLARTSHEAGGNKN